MCFLSIEIFSSHFLFLSACVLALFIELSRSKLTFDLECERDVLLLVVVKVAAKGEEKEEARRRSSTGCCTVACFFLFFVLFKIKEKNNK
ncbi:unnamed protein product [Trifolium pratense]|uniref:Uncharacterized protein n=2 Tax=Trifolium pratense TaxID=57577 RepID=A0ACB0IX49_TRIPR|nr:unnamed protein product [Trifolium pratense]CAJ2636435.1 unnamed protein product [Trifolium pratense]